MNDNHDDNTNSPATLAQLGDTSYELPQLPLNQGLVRASIETGDIDRALQLGFQHVVAVFDKVWGAMVTELTTEATFLRGRIKVSQKAVDKIDEELADEPDQIPAPMENGGVGGPGEPLKEVPPKNWQLRDKLAASLTIIGVVALSVASYFGVQATFADADLPIFENFEYLSYMLAFLVIAAGLATKFLGSVFNDPKLQDRYRQLIGIVGVASFFIWVVLFASLFEGLSGVFDPFAEPKHLLGWGFNLTHIIAEVFIAAGLFGHLDAIMLKYAPSRKIDNSARPPLLRAREEHLPTLIALTARLGKVEGALTRLEGLKQDALVLVETAIRQRINETPRDTLI